MAEGSPLYICTLDLSKAFDNVVHSQAFFPLFNNGVNLSVIFLFRFWYENSFLRINKSGSPFVRLCRGVKKGGVLSPSIFKMCISGILDEIRSNYFIGLSDVSYLAYADDLLLLCKNKQGLSLMISKVSRLFSKIGLSLNVEKCEFLVFNGPTSFNAPLACRGFSIPFVSAFR